MAAKVITMNMAILIFLGVTNVFNIVITFAPPAFTALAAWIWWG